MINSAIYITNTQNHAEGIINGAWYDLTNIKCELDIRDFIAEICPRGESWGIMDYELGGIRLDGQISTEDLANISYGLNKLGSTFVAYVQLFGDYDLSQCEQLSWGAHESVEAFGEYLVNECDLFGEVPPEIVPYIDYVQIIQDMMNNNQLVMNELDGKFYFFFNG